MKVFPRIADGSGEALDCSLTGQLVHIENQPPGWCTVKSKTYLAYQFLELVGKDKTPDLVVAIHPDPRYFNPAAPGAVESIGFPRLDRGDGQEGVAVCPDTGDQGCPGIDCTDEGGGEGEGK